MTHRGRGDLPACLWAEDIRISWGQYMRVGLAITPPVLLVVLAALALWLPLLEPA